MQRLQQWYGIPQYHTRCRRTREDGFEGEILHHGRPNLGWQRPLLASADSIIDIRIITPRHVTAVHTAAFVRDTTARWMELMRARHRTVAPVPSSQSAMTLLAGRKTATQKIDA
jgi:hypothetical protein